MQMKYTPDDEWVTVDGTVATVGITNRAQEQLGELVFIELPKQASRFQKGKPRVPLNL